MTLNARRLQLRSNGDQDLDLCSDLGLVGVGQGTSQLEQKVTQLFDQLRDCIYRYLMVVIGNASDAEEKNVRSIPAPLSLPARGPDN